MEKGAKVYVAGHKGLVGSAIWKNLKSKGYTNLIGRTSAELDLRNQEQVKTFFELEKPEYVFLAAAKVGGIIANNTYRADFIYDNLCIQNNIIGQSFKQEVKKLLFLGSTCIYPSNAPQPMPETCLLTSPLEYTNEPYAIAKIAGLKMCESFNQQYGTNYIAVMPTNLYGPNDNFDLEKSHVLPAIFRKIVLGKALLEERWQDIQADLNHLPIEGVNGTSTQAQQLDVLKKYGISKNKDGVSIEIWGTGKPMREFLWSEDMADACVWIMEQIDWNDLSKDRGKDVRNCHLNIGTGKEISIAELANLVKVQIGFHGKLYFNDQKPDGTMRKLTDVSRLNQLGWKHKIEIEQGISELYQWYLSIQGKNKG